MHSLGIQSIPASGGMDEQHGQELPFSPFILRMFAQVWCVSFSFDVQHQVRWKSSFSAGISSGKMGSPGDEDPTQRP